MTTEKPRWSVRKNISKAQQIRRGMPSREHARAQPEGKARAKPGTTGEGKYYHIEVRPKTEFATFHTQDVGKKGGIQRVAGKRGSGSWDTQKWLIEKNLADVEEGRLIPNMQDTEEIIDALGSTPKYRGGDRFEAKPHPNVPERLKPTKAQRRAQKRNIKKAQEARTTS